MLMPVQFEQRAERYTIVPTETQCTVQAPKSRLHPLDGVNVADEFDVICHSFTSRPNVISSSRDWALNITAHSRSTITTSSLPRRHSYHKSHACRTKLFIVCRRGKPACQLSLSRRLPSACTLCRCIYSANLRIAIGLMNPSQSSLPSSVSRVAPVSNFLMSSPFYSLHQSLQISSRSPAPDIHHSMANSNKPHRLPPHAHT